jgi:hypothetical protein
MTVDDTTNVKQTGVPPDTSGSCSLNPERFLATESLARTRVAA